MISNSLKVFRKYASDSCKLKISVIKKIIDSTKLDYSPEEFGRELDEKVEKERNYLGVKFLNSLLSRKERKSNFSIVFRTLLHYYYKKEVYPTVLTNCKILPAAKRKQLVGVRKICQFSMR